MYNTYAIIGPRYVMDVIRIIKQHNEKWSAALSQAQAMEEAAFKAGYSMCGRDADNGRYRIEKGWAEYLAQRGDKPVTCKWIAHRHGYYETGCKSASEENPYRQQVTPHCHLCGHSVEVVPQRDTQKGGE